MMDNLFMVSECVACVFLLLLWHGNMYRLCLSAYLLLLSSSSSSSFATRHYKLNGEMWCASMRRVTLFILKIFIKFFCERYSLLCSAVHGLINWVNAFAINALRLALCVFSASHWYRNWTTVGMESATHCGCEHLKSYNFKSTAAATVLRSLIACLFVHQHTFVRV